MNPQERAEAIGMLRAGMPLNDTATHFTVCKKTIQRMAHRYNLTGEVKDRARSGRPRKTTQAEDRRTYRRWTLRQWSDVIFSDESVVQLEKIGANVRVYRRKNERFADVNIPTALERRSVMVWGAISTDGKSELIMFQGNVNAVRYQDEALQRSLLPFMNLHNRKMKFMQDGATPHTARTTRAWLQQNGIELFGP